MIKSISIILTGIFCGLHSKAQVVCNPNPRDGSTVEVNVNSYSSFNLRCISPRKDPDDSLLVHNINEMSHWRLNGKEVQTGVTTDLGTIFLSGDKKAIIYKAPPKKPAGNSISFTAEYTNSGKNNNLRKWIYFWTIKIKEEAYTEVHLEDAESVMKVKTEMLAGYNMTANLSDYESKLSPQAKARLQQVRSQRPELLNMGNYRSNATATFIGDGGKHHFVISTSDPKNPSAGSLSFELPDSLVKTYETNSTDCKAGIAYGLTNCKIQVNTKGYVNESTDGKGKTISGLLQITLTEVGQPGGYVKGTFIGTLATYAKDCSTEGGQHSHPIELRETYGSFVAVRQANIIK
jgi:hypothetical protein